MTLHLVCGYRGDPVCFPPSCGGACPPGKEDTRPMRQSERPANVDPVTHLLVSEQSQIELDDLRNHIDFAVGKIRRGNFTHEDGVEFLFDLFQHYLDPTEPRCDECYKHCDAVNQWCGNCGNCVPHCLGYEECREYQEETYGYFTHS